MSPQELRKFLIENQMTQTELALKLGVSSGAVAHWLAGTRSVNPTAVKVVKFWQKYPQTLAYFQ